MKINPALAKYFKILILNALIQVTLRLLETFLILLNFGIPESLFKSEVLGCIYDLILTNSFLLILFPVFYLVSRISEKTADFIFVSFIALFTTIHFFILRYFLYQLSPLDTFLYKYSIKEIFLTVNTSDLSYVNVFLLLTILLAAIFFSNQVLRKIKFSRPVIIAGYAIILLSVSSLIFIRPPIVNLNNYAKNKSLYFFSRSLSYFSDPKADSGQFSNQNSADFQGLYPDKIFVNTEYPLLHEFKNNNVLKPFFNPFNSAPNIVILIVEGLNDDFIRNYRGTQLMPFLSQLTSQSLYWNRCFTLGERSFAAVPSILGSLPYGETGFSLLKKLPRHLSLVSILHASDYQTTYFDGQASWFHQKDRFYRYNNIDQIFDNSKFSEKYTKIIVGNDHFFWGYNDKDLFNQSFEVLDTLAKKPRLDIYFTGTSHSPFAISDPRYYDVRFSKLINELKNDSDIVFFNRYKKYIQSILFVNDALESFFTIYETRPDYDNTVFIITGDHPMTELPIANSLKRYHVPLIIYSKKLKAPKIFTHTVSHLDLYETLLSFLSEYNIRVPRQSAALGSNLISDPSDSEKRIAFMNDNREIVDFYSNNYFLSGEKLYSVGKNLSLTVSGNVNVLKRMQHELELFKSTNLNVSVNDKIMPDSLYYKFLGYKLLLSHPIDSGLIEFNSEYFSVVNSTVLPNKPICYDISFDSYGMADKELSLVYQLTAKNDRMIFWGSSDVTNDTKSFLAQVKIPQQIGSDSILYFKSYFWNKNSKDFKFRNLKYQLHRKE